MTATLEAALREASIDPLVRVALSLGEDILTVDRGRVLSLQETLEPYSHVAEVLLDNADGAFTSRDLRGYRVVLGWGAVTPAGEEYLDSPPLTVLRQELCSEPGVLTCRLLCQGVPDGLAEDRASESYAPGAADPATVQSLINDILSGSLACYSHCQEVPAHWDGADALATSYRPRDGFRLYRNGSRLAAVRRLLDFTGCAMRVESDGALHFLQPVTSGSDYDHEFSLAAGAHAFLQQAGSRSLVIPNRIVVRTPEDWPVAYSAEAVDAASYDLMPRTQYQEAAADSEAQAALIAESMLARHRLQSPVARLTVPLAPQVRVLDYLKVTDERLGDSVSGNAGRVRHRWSPGSRRSPCIWQTEIELGGWSSVRSLANRLEVYPTPQGYERLGRLSVKDLEAESIRAGNIVLEWLTETGSVDLSRVGDTLDSLADGSTYAKLKSTSISAGNILLSSAVQVKTGLNSKWYDVGYVAIDSDVGITIGGQDLVFAYGSQKHYVYPSSDELDIMSASGCDIRFLNGPVKLSCHMDPKTDDAYDLGYSTRRFGAVFCHDLYVSNEPWDGVDDLALVRGIRADGKDGRAYDRATIPPMLKAAYRREEKLRRRVEQIDRDDADVRAVLDRAIAKEKRPEKRAELEAVRAEVGRDRQERIDRYAASLDDDRCISLGDSVGLLFGAVRQLADKVEELEARASRT